MFFSSDGETEIATYLRAVKKQGTGYVYTSWKTFTSARAGIDYTLSKSGVASDSKTVGDVSFITRWLFNSNSIDPNTITKPGSYFYTNNDSEFFKDSVVELKSDNVLCAFSGNGTNYIQILYCIDTSQNLVVSYTRWKDSENNFGEWVKNAVDTAKVNVDSTLSNPGEAADAGAVGEYASLDRYSLNGKPTTKPNPDTCLWPGTYYYDASDKGKFGETGVLLKDRNILVVSTCGRTIVQQSLFVWNNADDTFMYWRFIINGNVIGKWHDASSIYTDTSLSDQKYAANAGAVGEKAFLTRERGINFNEIETFVKHPGVYYINPETITDDLLINRYGDIDYAWLTYVPYPGNTTYSYELDIIFHNDNIHRKYYGVLDNHVLTLKEYFDVNEETIDVGAISVTSFNLSVAGIYTVRAESVNWQFDDADIGQSTITNPIIKITPVMKSNEFNYSIMEVYSFNSTFYKKFGINFNPGSKTDQSINSVISYN